MLIANHSVVSPVILILFCFLKSPGFPVVLLNTVKQQIQKYSKVWVGKISVVFWDCIYLVKIDYWYYYYNLK